jgi:hypothetical protein
VVILGCEFEVAIIFKQLFDGFQDAIVEVYAYLEERLKLVAEDWEISLYIGHFILAPLIQLFDV